jgi:hypothetical protein
MVLLANAPVIFGSGAGFGGVALIERVAGLFIV